MTSQVLSLLPELLLLLGAVLTLLLGSFLPRHRQWPARAVAATSLGGALLAALLAPAGPALALSGTYAVDGPTLVARIVVPAAALVVLAMGVEEVAGQERESEFAVLVVLATLGSVVLAGTSDLALLAVAYLLASVPLYALTGFGRTPTGTEAALKFYLLGAFLGVALLLGATVLFGLAGGTTYADLARALPHAPVGPTAVGLVAVLGALAFKIGAVPGHFWVPDVSEAASPSAAAALSTLPKIGGLLAAYRLVLTVPPDRLDWPLLVAALAAVTMTLGNLAAFGQEHPRRLLGWSTVSQAGYLLMAVAAAGRSQLSLPALGYYLAAYAVTNLAAFAVTVALPAQDRLEHFRGLATRRPLLALALLVSLLGLVGIPPSAGFVGKLTVFTAAWEAGLSWLVVVAAGNTVASLFYYLRWLAPAFDWREAAAGTPLLPWASGTAVVASAASLALGIGAVAGLAPHLSVLR